MSQPSADIKKLIAVLDDEEDIVELVSFHLKSGGFDVKPFGRGNDLLAWLANSQPDLLLLDLMLPDLDGLEICRRLRASPKTAMLPIIMITAKGEELDRVLGLEIGADDYMSKPFSPRELVARVRAVLRRSEGVAEEEKEIPPVPAEKEIFPGVRIDLRKYKVWVKEHEVKLTVTEFRILAILAENKGWILSREQLLEKLWGADRWTEPRTVDVHIRHLREKLGDDGTMIENLRGAGYKLAE